MIKINDEITNLFICVDVSHAQVKLVKMDSFEAVFFSIAFFIMDILFSNSFRLLLAV